MDSPLSRRASFVRRQLPVRGSGRAAGKNGRAVAVAPFRAAAASGSASPARPVVHLAASLERLHIFPLARREPVSDSPGLEIATVSIDRRVRQR
jgi:hypothetical protein